ncbi:tetratricopeptide repeat-containing sensor histidine kinase [Marinigracilibium pacificum]|uniref:histidine kinase n=1 Tax=Marinigracilibium pacificum TaxID=2729599 RepID=A0A848IZ31_9BACT|nr:ATP-binding protein [Marinigracilibium pacificum]NMM49537.1 sensor histidine kinase [Marinigracilibium pacificum]
MCRLNTCFNTITFLLVLLLFFSGRLSAQEKSKLPDIEEVKLIGVDRPDTSGLHHVVRNLEDNLDHFPVKSAAFYYHQLGKYYSLQSPNYRKAANYFNRSHELVSDLPDSLKNIEYSTLENLGLVYTKLSKFDSSVWAYELALKFIEQINNETYNSKQALLYIHLTELALNGFNNLKLSKEYLDKAKKYRNFALDTTEIDCQLATSYGRYFFNEGNYDLAKEYFQKSLKLAELRNPRERRNLQNISYSYLANINFDIGNYKEALKYDLLSLELEKGENNPANLIASYNNLGEDYLLVGKPDSAFYYYSQGLQLAENLGSAERKIEVLGNLHEFYAGQNDMSSAYNTLKERSFLIDTLTAHKTKIRYNELLRKYEAEKQEKEIKEQQDQIDLLKAQEESARLRLILIISVIVIGLVIAFFIIRNNIKTREMKARQIQEMSQFKDSVTGMLAHDLKNPLSVILKKHDNNETVNYMAGKMLTLVQNMLDVRKLEQAKLVLQKEPYSLETIIDDASNQVKPLLDEKNIHINTDLDSSWVNVDKELIQRVFINLFTNAIKYSPLNSSILVKSESTGNKVAISITDSGNGISEEDINVIFEPYRQVSPLSSGNVASTGLGLTFCKLAMEAHHSNIDVDSNPGNGTTFTFELEKSSVQTQAATKVEVENNNQLTSSERSYASEVLPKLQTLKFHNALFLDDVMDEVDTKDLKNLKPIIKALSNAAFSDNRAHYDKLIEEMKQMTV